MLYQVAYERPPSFSFARPDDEKGARRSDDSPATSDSNARAKRKPSNCPCLDLTDRGHRAAAIFSLLSLTLNLLARRVNATAACRAVSGKIWPKSDCK